jgi:hypothetical protein
LREWLKASGVVVIHDSFDVTLFAEKGKLMLRQKWLDAVPLEPLAKDEFRAEDTVAVFRRDSAGKVTGYVIFGGRARGMQFERRR